MQSTLRPRMLLVVLPKFANVVFASPQRYRNLRGLSALDIPISYLLHVLHSIRPSLTALRYPFSFYGHATFAS